MTFIVSKNLLLQWNECEAFVISKIYACFNGHTDKKSVHFNCDTLNPVLISIYTLIYAIQRILVFLPPFGRERRVSVTIVHCFICRRLQKKYLCFLVFVTFLLLFLDIYAHCWKPFCIQYAFLICLYHLTFSRTVFYTTVLFSACFVPIVLMYEVLTLVEFVVPILFIYILFFQWKMRVNICTQNEVLTSKNNIIGLYFSAWESSPVHVSCYVALQE